MRLTLPQRDVYFEQLLYPEDPIYNIGAKISVVGYLNYELLHKSYTALIDQHDAYRSVLVGSMSDAQIEILETHNAQLEFIDFSEDKSPETAANTYMKETFVKPFNLQKKALLHQFVLIKVRDDFHYIFSKYHHIITDGWGTSLMFQRWVQNYNELVTQGNISTEYPFSYKDFVANDAAYLASEDFQHDKSYWTEKFKTLPNRIFEKKTARTIHQSKREFLMLKRETYNQLGIIAKANRSTTFHVILAVLYTYIGRSSQQKDLTIGLPVLNRSKSIFKKTVGLFMGINALRMKVDFEDTFENLVLAIRQQLRQDYRHQRFPIGKLIEELQLFQEKDQLINMTLSYEKQNYSAHFEGTKTTVIPMTHQAERVALAVYIREFDDTEAVKIDFDYNINYFDAAEMQQFITHFEILLNNVLREPSKKLSQYKYLTEEEELKLYNFNQTKTAYPREETLLTFFKKQVKISPTKIAVKNHNTNFTYQELDTISDKIASYILKHFSEEPTLPIAVLLDRNPNFIAILLGILKAGRAYIPLDPSFPKDRLQYIVMHSGVNYVISTEELLSKVAHDTTTNVLVTELLNTKSESVTIEDEVHAENTAYIIYTSGSTGNPKGVEIGHRSLLNFLLSMKAQPGISQEDVLFSVTTQSFDISMLEFFVPLISGGTLYIADKEILNKPLQLIEEINRVQPTVIQATPSFYQLLFNANWNGNKALKVLCGGDLLSKALAEKLVQNCGEVWNMYGPTETTIWSSIKQIKKPADAAIIGKPIHNTQLYILDAYLNVLPIGAIGTLYICGDGLAKGYYKSPELTATKFIESPFVKGERIYDTGDLGKWNPNGEIAFYGRQDNQVKIHGYRIELEEIEKKLDRIPEIKTSVVIAKKLEAQEAILVAYIIYEKTQLDIEIIIQQLRKELPAYMIPQVIIPMEAFPLTPNQKVDRKTLAALEISNIKEANEIAQQPTTSLEKVLCTLFQHVLELPNEVGVTDNFFRLGGHSLSAVKLLSAIAEEKHYQIPLKSIFDYPTVASLANYLETEETQQLPTITSGSIKEFYPVTNAQYGMWLASQQLEKSVAYQMFANYKIVGIINENFLAKAFLAIIENYDVLRTNFIEIEGIPHQKIASREAYNFTIDKLTKETYQQYIHKEFDLEKDALLRVGLVYENNTPTSLLFVTHHIIMDGWSLNILMQQFIQNYKALIANEKIQQKIVQFQYQDYTLWLADKLAKKHAKNSEFWNSYLANYSWKNLVPHDENLEITAHSGATYSYEIDNSQTTVLKNIAETHQITVHTLLLTAFNVLLYKTYAHDDICVGTINSGRNFLHADDQLGMFVKTLPIRTQLETTDSFSAIAVKTHENVLTLDAFQDMPAATYRNLRLDILIAFQDASMDFENIRIHKQLELIEQPEQVKYSRLPLLINFAVKPSGINTTITYNTHNYEEATIELLMLRFTSVLKSITNNPKISLHEIDTTLTQELENTLEIDFNF
ncbi:amino acid adenylation domain-containing protein [Kordia sp. YSTF-M3]|uniref:Amino acid adenylation domain-containing protein n=1 Tax=Kordia aestuariivivens TaxID=2759037 RepID=A0ABR7QD48_9FLAO|nr:non-ribosomal peptide synthetase [Kordia aestuariivivens]MBC8756496.1 amino acid adenylation domain-containing protein [Kordia aestuariivivens]